MSPNFWFVKIMQLNRNIKIKDPTPTISLESWLSWFWKVRLAIRIVRYPDTAWITERVISIEQADKPLMSQLGISWYSHRRDKPRHPKANFGESLTDRLSDWLTLWLTDSLTDRVSDWPNLWLTDSLTDRLSDWPTLWLTESLTDQLSDWPTLWPTESLTQSYRNHYQYHFRFQCFFASESIETKINEL